MYDSGGSHVLFRPPFSVTSQKGRTKEDKLGQKRGNAPKKYTKKCQNWLKRDKQGHVIALYEKFQLFLEVVNIIVNFVYFFVPFLLLL